MGRGTSRSVTHREAGVSLDMGLKTPSPQVKLPQGPPTVPGPGPRNTGPRQQKRHLQNPQTTMFSLKHFSCPQELRRAQIHHQPHKAQLVRISPPVPHDQPPKSGVHAPASGLASISGPTGRIFPHSRQKVPTQVSCVLIRGGPLLLQSSSLRTKRGSIHLHKTHAVSSRHPPSPGGISSGVPRRLGRVGALSERNKHRIRPNGPMPHSTRLPHQSRKITPYTLNRYRVVRCPVAVRPRYVGNPSRHSREVSRPHPPSPHEPFLHPQRMGTSHGNVELRVPNSHTHSPPSPTHPQTTTPRVTCQQGPTTTHSPVPQERPSSVAIVRPSSTNRGLSTTIRHSPSLDRCLNDGLGGPHELPHRLGVVEPPGTATPYQHSRSQSGPAVHPPPGPVVLSDPFVHRQCTSPVRAQEAFRKSSIAFTGSVFTCPDSPEKVPSSQTLQDFHTPEQQSRRPQQTVILNDGLVASSTHIRRPGTPEGPPRDSPDGELSRHNTATVRASESHHWALVL